MSDIYEQITNRIIALLKQGVAPWRSPFFATVGLPANFATGNLYRGINVFLLASHCFTSPYFLTYLQAKDLGGQVRKGERGALVVKYGTYSVADDTSTTEERRYLKTYIVFNSSQIDGIAFPEPPVRSNLPTAELLNKARQIVANMPNPPAIRHGVASAYYEPEADIVMVPEQRYFRSETDYYATLFHELSHATGHHTRLARKSLLENKGSDLTLKTYAEEELVAEMSASFLNAHAGIIDTQIENSAAYLKGWIDALTSSDAKRWIVKAASEAQKAADLIIGNDSHAP